MINFVSVEALIHELLPNMIRRHFTFLPLLAVLLAIADSGASSGVNVARCDRSCGTGKTAKRVPYPFGFSRGCGIELECSNGSEIGIGSFQVLNITSDSVLVRLPAECNRSLHSISPLFGSNYSPTWRNDLLLQGCTSPLNGCVIPTSFIENRYNVGNCHVKGGNENISCFYRGNDGFNVFGYKDLARIRCRSLFSSIAAVGSDSNSLEFQLLELGWWVNGSCGMSVCDADASCVTVRMGGERSGFRCKCRDGFVGDGYVAGAGCRRGEQGFPVLTSLAHAFAE